MGNRSLAGILFNSGEYLQEYFLKEVLLLVKAGKVFANNRDDHRVEVVDEAATGTFITSTGIGDDPFGGWGSHQQIKFWGVLEIYF